uniref:Photosystem I subunit IX n=1 Tax=Orostachys minuta TaxID=2930424 RepID=A0A976MZZ7_9MAGN|nr:photosystem I subunit IX [Orostachys minuta]UPO69261.1 photosystem I subunit IX [Orostachys minuta]
MFNARSKNIFICGTDTKYYMVRIFSRSIDRDQSFIPRCADISFFSF